VDDEGPDDGVVVLSVAKPDEALDPPKFDAGPVRGVRELNAEAALGVVAPLEARELELLEGRGVLVTSFSAFGRLAVVLRRRRRRHGLRVRRGRAATSGKGEKASGSESTEKTERTGEGQETTPRYGDARRTGALAREVSYMEK